MTSLLVKKKTYFEIYYFITRSLISTGFSSKTSYLIFKQRPFAFSILSRNNPYATTLKFRLSRFDLKKNNNSGKLTGFYHAIW